MSEEAALFMSVAVDLVRRFLPDADQRTLSAASICFSANAAFSCAIASSFQVRRSIWHSTNPRSIAWPNWSAAGRSAA